MNKLFKQTNKQKNRDQQYQESPKQEQPESLKALTAQISPNAKHSPPT